MINQELLDKYSQYLTARAQSLNYLNVMRLWLAYLDEQKIEPQNATQETITAFFTLHKEYSSSTRNQFIKAGRSFYAYMNIEKSVWTQIKLLRVERKIPDYLTEEDLDKGKQYLITNFSNKLTPIKIRAILDFLFYSGCRKEEILTLKRADINLEENVAKVYGKGKKERIVCYPDKVKKELIEYFASENEEDNAFNLTIAKIHYVMRLLKKYLGKNIYTHLFRHSGARAMIRKGMPIGTVSRLLGHSSINTTIIYIDPSIDEIKNQYRDKMK